MADLEAILASVSSSNRKIAGRAQCDLAQLIWSGKFDSTEIQRLLQSDDRHIRGATAWAIADLNGPPEGVKWLMQTGVRDTYDGVRYWAVRCASEMPEIRKLVASKDIGALREDESESVRRIALKVWPDELSTANAHNCG